MSTERKRKEEELADLKRELASLKLSLSIVGEHPESSKPLVARRDSTLIKIKQLEEELRART